MKTLIIPCAGQSSRFNGVRPKFLLTHPNGNLMITEAIKGMKPERYDRIVIIALKEHQDKYKFGEALINEFNTEFTTFKLKIGNPEVLFINSSKNQPDTIYQGLKLLESINPTVEGQIIIKDCDNFFNLDIMEGNSVAVCDIGETNSPANKSYVQIGEANSIVNIVEKQVISNQFCCGAYSFEDVNEFMSVYEKLQNNDNLYVSHIIYQMILDGKLFFTNKATNYVDWGTLEDWLAYKNQFKTLFVDLDGVLVKSSSKHFAPIWGTTDAIQKNVAVINKMYDTGKVTVIITTARSKEFEEATLNQIKRIGLKYHMIIMELPHTQRLLINDFSQTAPYPTAIAINLRRNEGYLNDFLDN